LTQVIPELASSVGFQQHTPHHAYDVFTHTAHVVSHVSGDLTLRWAALLHDVGKVPTFTMDENGRGHFLGHAQVSARLADEILRRLKAPTQLREDVVFLIDHHMLVPTAERKLLRRYLSRYGTQRLIWLMALQKADCKSKGVPCDMSVFAQMEAEISSILAESSCLSLKDLALNGHDLMAMGYTGPVIGKILNHLLQLVVDEELPNTRAALLAAIPQPEENHEA
jgi:tRNA nucleotidyltransferase (CCA-adding enzyme)